MKKNEARIAYKSRIKLSSVQKLEIDNVIFIINQLYNFSIEILKNEQNQNELIHLGYGKKIPYNQNEEKFVIIKKLKTRNYINQKFKEYAEKRKLKIKGLSKPIQLKLEDVVNRFNKIYLS
jgi:hypothetical protein